jgi:hypothetical protein
VLFGRGQSGCDRGIGRTRPGGTVASALFLDATFISVRPSGPKEGVLVA